MHSCRQYIIVKAETIYLSSVTEVPYERKFL